MTSLGNNELNRFTWIILHHMYIHGLEQDCGNSSALAMELPQSCTKSTWPWGHNQLNEILFAKPIEWDTDSTLI